MQFVPILLQRCAASLLVCKMTKIWQCQLCDRRYLHVSATRLLLVCVYCGTSLGVTHAGQALTPSAMVYLVNSMGRPQHTLAQGTIVLQYYMCTCRKGFAGM